MSYRAMSYRRILVAFALLAFTACDSSGGDSSVADVQSGDMSAPRDVERNFSLGSAGELSAELPAETLVSGLQIELLLDGQPVVGEDVHLTVRRGGGAVESPVTTDADGRASVSWTLGFAPVANELEIRASQGAVVSSVVILATRIETIEPTSFLDVNAFLSQEGVAGSTEDLAFDGEGSLFMGAPGALLSIAADATPSLRTLSGDSLDGPLGIAFDDAGGLWVADSAGSALRYVSPDGAVTTPLTDNGEDPLGQPNYVAVGPQGRIFLSDPCLGEVLCYDPTADTVETVVSFDVAVEGGPNGLAFGPSGSLLYVTTENTGLLCQHAGVDAVANVAGLYTVALVDDGFGEKTAVAEGIGLFADGLAFDREGNLYVAVDRIAALALEESAVEVLPRDGDSLIPFLSAADRIFANVAFGTGDFGATTMYVALLTVPPFTPAEARGVERIDIGIPGLPLYGRGR